MAVRVSGVAASAASPGEVTSAIVERLGATVVERVAGSDAAVAFGRMPGAPTVSVAGRAFNVEVSVGRDGRGLLVDIGTPLLGPQLGSWAGGLTETA